MLVPIGKYAGTYREEILEIETFNHTFVDGVSGAGKSTLLEDVAIRLIREGNPILYIDPHGTSAKRLLNFIPKRYSRKVVYINPLSPKVVGISIFSGKTKEEKELDVASFAGMLKSIAGDAWGFETANVIDGATTAASEMYDHPTPAHVYLFVMREAIRRQVAETTENPLLKDFIHEYDDLLRKSERMAKFAPSVNKLKPFVSPILRPLFNQSNNLPLVELMNNAIIIVDLDKGRVGEINAALIGAAIMNHIGIYAFRRPATGRRPFHMFIDEFQTFSHGINWTSFFAELRKFDIRVWLATQSVTQVPERWIDPILANVNNIITFAVGDADAERMSKAFGKSALASTLMWFNDFEVSVKSKLDTQRHYTSHVELLRPLTKLGNESRASDVIKTSLQRWGRDRKQVDAAILKLLRGE